MNMRLWGLLGLASMISTPLAIVGGLRAQEVPITSPPEEVRRACPEDMTPIECAVLELSDEVDVTRAALAVADAEVARLRLRVDSLTAELAQDRALRQACIDRNRDVDLLFRQERRARIWQKMNCTVGVGLATGFDGGDAAFGPALTCGLNFLH